MPNLLQARTGSDQKDRSHWGSMVQTRSFEEVTRHRGRNSVADIAGIAEDPRPHQKTSARTRRLAEMPRYPESTTPTTGSVSILAT